MSQSLLRASMWSLTLALVFVHQRYRIFSIPYYDYAAMVTAVIIGLTPRGMFIPRALLFRVAVLLGVVLVLGSVAYSIRALAWWTEPSVDLSALPRMLVGMLIYAVVWKAVSRQPKLLRTIVHAWLVAAIILGVLLLDALHRMDRFTGTFEDPNYFGSYQAAVATVFVALLGAPNELMQRLWERILGILALLAAGVSVVLSFSRGAVVSLLVGFGSVVGVRFLRNTRRVGRQIAIIAVFALAAYGAVSVSPLSRFLDRLSIQSVIETGGSGRVEIWEAAIESLADNPLGRGWGGRVYALGRERPSHNFALEMGVQFGVLGMAVAVVLYVLFLQDCLRLLAKPDSVANAFGGAGLALLTASLTLDVLAWRHFWFVLGVVGALARLETLNRDSCRSMIWHNCLKVDPRQSRELSET